MSTQRGPGSAPGKADIARWVVSIGGANENDHYNHSRVAKAGAAAGKRVFEEVIKGKMKLTNDA